MRTLLRHLECLNDITMTGNPVKPNAERKRFCSRGIAIL